MITRQKIAATLVGSAIAATTLGIGLAGPAFAAAVDNNHHAVSSANGNDYVEPGTTPYGTYQNRHKRGGN